MARQFINSKGQYNIYCHHLTSVRTYWVWLVSKENKNKFQILARTDSLTGIYNRYGFDESAEKTMDKNPKAHFVAALLDIDDFKFINDIYGHAYGD